ncbi:hypothetical protein Angca_000452, partial [Angiostrongylus cantonensis]
GGMAELKAITGDEPYTGAGNPPAPVPRPTGFWGRPRYSPILYDAYNPYGVRRYVGADPYYGRYNRFSSFGYSPYGL